MSDSERPGQSPYEAPQVERLLRRVIGIIEQAKQIPLSNSVKLDNPDEVLDELEEILERLPSELRAAKWLLKQREEFLAKTKREADEMIEVARARVESMVQRTEVVKAADARARALVDAGESEARRLKLEAEDFCDQRLASFEIVLERTMKVVAAGRAKLQGTAARPEHPSTLEEGEELPENQPDPGPGPRPRNHLEAVPDDRSSFFDQDDG